jgi:hypothetical protein
MLLYMVMVAMSLWIRGAVLPGSSNDFSRSLPAPLAKYFCQVEFARVIRAPISLLQQPNLNADAGQLTP